VIRINRIAQPTGVGLCRNMTFSAAEPKLFIKPDSESASLPPRLNAAVGDANTLLASCGFHVRL